MKPNVNIDAILKKTLIFFIKIFRRLFKDKAAEWQTNKYCDYLNQEGNDEIFNYLNNNYYKGVMISKFGTVELEQALRSKQLIFGITYRECIEIIRGRLTLAEPTPNFELFNNAGVFPYTADMALSFGAKALNDCQKIDILGSYITNEHIIEKYIREAIKVNLDAFYAPWLFRNPWTRWLKGKKILVISPFVDSISHQYYHNREKLFKDKDVLPQFKSLTCLKAVQSIAGEKVPFETWFEALGYMEEQIDVLDFDVAIIGCGAYGMSLAAHVKQKGKVGIHLAGWTQMLFGVYGERWVSQQPQYSSVINEYWIRPYESEVVKNSNLVEDGCYW